MVKDKKAERKHLSQTGTILFDGTLTLQLNGKTYQVRTEYHGLDLQRASQNHEVIVLIKQHMPYNEIDTGYIVRAKEYDKQHCCRCGTHDPEQPAHGFISGLYGGRCSFLCCGL